MKKIYFFCENKNQVLISNEIEKIVKPESSIYICYRVLNDQGAFNQIRKKGKKYIELDEKYIDSILLDIDGGKSRKEVIRKYAFKCINDLDIDLYRFSTVVAYNDSSLSTCLFSRKYSDAICLVQDGFIGLIPVMPFWKKICVLFLLVVNLLFLGKLYRPLNCMVRESKFGSSLPARILVGGKYNALIARLFYWNASSVVVSGLIRFGDDIFNEDISRKSSSGAGASVLFADQCLLKYDQIDFASWRKNLMEMLSVLSPYKVIYKFHPSELPEVKREVKELAGDNVIFVDDSVLDRSFLEDVSIVVTYYSTSFLDAKAAGVPTVFCDFNGNRLRIPKMKSNLIRNVGTPLELGQVVTEYLGTGVFRGNEKGMSFEYMFSKVDPCRIRQIF